MGIHDAGRRQGARRLSRSSRQDGQGTVIRRTALTVAAMAALSAVAKSRSPPRENDMIRAALALTLCAVLSTVLPDANAAEPVTLKLANPGPPQGPVSMRIYAPLADRIAKATDGEV